MSCYVPGPTRPETESQVVDNTLVSILVALSIFRRVRCGQFTAPWLLVDISSTLGPGSQ